MTPGARSEQRAGILSPPRLFSELLLVAGTAVVQVGATAMATQNQPEHRTLGLGAALLLALGVLALPLRHRFPVGVLAFTFCTTLVYWSLDNPKGPVFLSLVLALIHVVLIGRRWVAITLLVTGFVLFPWLGYLLGHADPPDLLALAGLAAWLVALISVTEVVRSRRDRAREAARSEAEAMRRQAADERVRIARDLHDSVAHNMSLISIHAGVALHLMEGEAARGNTTGDEVREQVKSSLATIKEASREALVELRSVLGVLRHVDEVDEADQTGGTGDPGAEASGPGGSGGAPRPSAAPRAPVPGLDRLDSLVERARSVGLDVRLDLLDSQGPAAPLPRPVEVAAYRIVQESLTNVSRHSDSVTALVRIGQRNGMLTVDVLDEGSGQPPASPDLPGGGNGIIGMRERAAAVGGRLQVGPRSGRGFAVHAELPLGPGHTPDARDVP